LKPYSIGLQPVFARKIELLVGDDSFAEGNKLLAPRQALVDNICENS
jgi:hypothetical protein